MAATANAKIRIGYDGKQAESGLKKLKGTVKSFAAGFGGLVIINKVNQFMREAADLAKVQIQAETQLAAVLKSTGHAAGLSANELVKMAKGFQDVTTFGDEAVIEAQALLLTFTKIGKDVFPQATETVLNMSKALGQDLKSSAIQLGKALQDPIIGATALRRVGVNLSQQQMDQIKILVEQNKTYEAQQLILSELETEFGGVARALAQTDVGKLEQMENKLSDIKEEIGVGIIPLLVKWNELVLDIITGFKHVFKLTVNSQVVELDKQIGEIQNRVDAMKNPENRNLLQKLFYGVSTPEQLEGLIQSNLEQMDELIKKRDELIEKEVGGGPPIVAQSGVVLGGVAGGTGGGAGGSKKQKESSLSLEIIAGGMALSDLEERASESYAKLIEGHGGYVDAWSQTMPAMEQVAELRASIRNGEIESMDEAIAKLNEYKEAGIISEEEYQDAMNETMELQEKRAEATVVAMAMVFGGLSQLLGQAAKQNKKFAKLYKATATAEAIVNTYAAANASYKAMAGIPYVGPALGAIAAVGAITAGLANVAAINAQKFAAGGLAGGSLSQTTTPDNINAVLGRGEYVMPSRQTAQNIELLESIRNNTANIRGGRGQAVYNFYAASEDQILTVMRNNERRNRTGVLM